MSLRLGNGARGKYNQSPHIGVLYLSVSASALPILAIIPGVQRLELKSYRQLQDLRPAAVSIVYTQPRFPVLARVPLGCARHKEDHSQVLENTRRCARAV